MSENLDNIIIKNNAPKLNFRLNRKLIAIIFILLAIPLTVGLALISQEIRSRATLADISTIQVSPGSINSAVGGKSVPMSALAYDSFGNPLFKDVVYQWTMSSGNSVGTLSRVSGDLTEFIPLKSGCGQIIVTAIGGGKTVTKSISILVRSGDIFPDCANTKVTPVPTSTLPPMTIKITKPNGGETISVGSTYKITWDSSSDIDQVMLGYSSGPGSLNTFTGLIPNTGSYDWKVNVGNMGTAISKQVKIDIQGYDTGVGSKNDQSDNFFTVLNTAISPTPTLVPSTIKYNPVISTRVLPNGAAGVNYSANIIAVDRNSDDKLNMSISGLPSGLTQGTCTQSINASNYAQILCPISGRIPVPGTYSFWVGVKDINGAIQGKKFSFVIEDIPPLITTTSLPQGSIGMPYSATIWGYDPTPEDNLTMTATNLPIGLTLGNCVSTITTTNLKQISCKISGTVTSQIQYNISVTLKDNYDGAITGRFILTIK